MNSNKMVVLELISVDFFTFISKKNVYSVKNEKMKVIYTVLSLIYFCTHIYSQHSDLKEFGYRGNVQEVRTKTYVLFDSKTGKLSDSLQLFSTVIFSVDENGNFQEVKTIPAADTNVFSLNKYSFVNQRKSSMQTFDTQGNEQKSDTASFQWVNDKSYILTYQYNNRIYEITTILNDDFRDYSGITHVYDLVDGKRKFVSSEKSENFFDSDGHIEKIVVTDLQSMKKNTLYLKEKILDKNGNLTQFKVVDESKNIVKFVEREFVYGK
jgi:hypothetical protein